MLTRKRGVIGVTSGSPRDVRGVGSHSGGFDPSKIKVDGEFLAMVYVMSKVPYYHASGLSGVQYLDSKEVYGSYRAPRQGRAYVFDGADDRGEIASAASLNLTASLTITAWIKTSVTTRTIVGGYEASATYDGYGLDFDVTGTESKLSFWDGTSWKQSDVVAAILSGSWVHVAVSVTSGGSSAYYVNGVASGTFTSGVLRSYSGVRSLGASSSGSSPFSGSMRDVRIYNVAKDATAIAAIYAGDYAAPDTTGLVAGYWCNEEAGTVGYDWSGNGNHLTLTNITEGTFHATDADVTNNPANSLGHTNTAGVIIPRNEASPTLDAAGGALQYSGQCPYPVLVDTPCITNSGGTIYLSAPHLSGSETVVSFAGSTTTPTISAGRVDWDSGTTLASLVLSDGTNYPCQEGPGLANANRTVYDVSGDSNHATLVNGTVSDIWADRLSGTVKDWCIEYGGDIGADGEFVPGLIGGSNAADGTPKTLPAGQSMNPYSRRNLNPFTAAELNGRSVPTSIGPRTDVSLLVTPTNSAFNRSSATQDDRIAIFSEALTGATLTSMQTYAPFTLTPNAYAIKIKTDNGGTSSSTQFTFPATGTYTISWGDGAVETLTGAQTHTYPAAGTYVVQVTGGLTSVTYGGDKLKLLEIMQWGSIAWTTAANAYKGCGNMQGTFTDAPNFSAVTNMSSMFQSATFFNHAIDSWDVSSVTDMSYMFYIAGSFNQPLNSWDVSSVTNMSGMFHSATSFNQPLNSWDVSSVTNMAAMFQSATSFDQAIDSWDVSSVTDMSYMFRGATAFNQSIGSWDVIAVTNIANFMLNKTAANYSASHLDAIYNQWSLLTLQPSLSINFGTIKYTAAGSAGRAVLTGAPNSWTIVDGGI